MSYELLLLERARRLDLEALAHIHDLYYPVLFRYFVFRTNDTVGADDLTSEVFARFLSALQGRGEPPKTLRDWLFGVASHVASDYYRQHYKTQHLHLPLDESLPAADDPPDAIVETSQNHFWLRKSINGLTGEQQTVIALRYGEGLPFNKIAVVMGKSIGAVKQLQARALVALARQMGNM